MSATVAPIEINTDSITCPEENCKTGRLLATLSDEATAVLHKAPAELREKVLEVLALTAHNFSSLLSGATELLDDDVDGFLIATRVMNQDAMSAADLIRELKHSGPADVLVVIAEGMMPTDEEVDEDATLVTDDRPFTHERGHNLL